jgi:hypothetical protein
MAELFDPEPEDETGTIGPDSVYADIVEDTQPFDADDVDAWDEDTELDEGMPGLA